MSFSLEPITPAFGAFVRGLNLSSGCIEPGLAQALGQALHTHRLLIVKDQGKLSAEAQLRVSEWFGKIESTFYKHPASPHPDIFRVSNDEQQGCRNVGRSGWHIDGSFMARPFKVQTMHFWAVNKGGSTLFAPLNEVLDGLEPQTRERWERLWFVTDGGIVHPLVWPHPVDGRPTMCFHCGPHFARGIAVDYRRQEGSARAVLAPDQVSELLAEITSELGKHAYTHEWELGELALIDNLAVAHYAHPDTQAPPETSGLRVLHRTTVQGEHTPEKG